MEAMIWILQMKITMVRKGCLFSPVGLVQLFFIVGYFCIFIADTMAETGTLAGIISAVGVALVGAVTSYISYQKKKLCFSIQRKSFALKMKQNRLNF